MPCYTLYLRDIFCIVFFVFALQQCFSRATLILQNNLLHLSVVLRFSRERVFLPATPLFCNFNICNLRHREHRCLCFTTSVFNVEKSINRCSLKFSYCCNAQMHLFLVWCIRGVGLIPCRALFGAKYVFCMSLLFPFSVGLLGDMVGRAFRQLTPAPSFVTGCFGTFRS